MCLVFGKSTIFYTYLMWDDHVALSTSYFLTSLCSQALWCSYSHLIINCTFHSATVDSTVTPPSHLSICHLSLPVILGDAQHNIKVKCSHPLFSLKDYHKLSHSYLEWWIAAETQLYNTWPHIPYCFHTTVMFRRPGWWPFPRIPQRNYYKSLFCPWVSQIPWKWYNMHVDFNHKIGLGNVCLFHNDLYQGLFPFQSNSFLSQNGKALSQFHIYTYVHVKLWLC